MMWTRRVRQALARLTAVLVVGAAAAQSRVPELQIETLGPHQGAAARLRRFDPEQLQRVVRLVGLEDPGGPIHVVLAPEDTEVARATPSWIAGFAHGPSETVVLFPGRSPRYPHDSLEAVLHHEIAHVLIRRAAGGEAVPRWFNEGLSTASERAWSFEDRRQLAWALAAGTPTRMQDLDPYFQRGGVDAARAYALASAFVRNLTDRHGSDAPARILESLRRGTPFDDAFRQATGESLVESERVFHARIGSWERWIPLATSPYILWTGVTLLAIYAIWIGRRRRIERRRKWEEEEETSGTPRTAEDPSG